MNSTRGSKVTKFSRQSRQKDARYAHLLGGDVMVESVAETDSSEVPKAMKTDAPLQSERITKLEGEVATLDEQLKDLRRQFEDFKSQFG